MGLAHGQMVETGPVTQAPTRRVSGRPAIGVQHADVNVVAKQRVLVHIHRAHTVSALRHGEFALRRHPQHAGDVRPIQHLRGVGHLGGRAVVIPIHIDDVINGVDIGHRRQRVVASNGGWVEWKGQSSHQCDGYRPAYKTVRHPLLLILNPANATGQDIVNTSVPPHIGLSPMTTGEGQLAARTATGFVMMQPTRSQRTDHDHRPNLHQSPGLAAPP